MKSITLLILTKNMLTKLQNLFWHKYLKIYRESKYIDVKHIKCVTNACDI